MGDDVISLDALAGRINLHQSRMEAAMASALEIARDAGLALIEAKKLVGHGEWLPWLEANCRVSASMAGKYMKIATGWDRLAGGNSEHVPNLTVREAVKALAKPRAGKAECPTIIDGEAVVLDGPFVDDREPSPAATTTQESTSPENILSQLEAVLMALPVHERTRETNTALERLEMFSNVHCRSRMTLREVVEAMPGTRLPDVRKQMKGYLDGLPRSPKLFRHQGDEAVTRDQGEEFIRLQTVHGWHEGRSLTEGWFLHHKPAKSSSTDAATADREAEVIG